MRENRNKRFLKDNRAVSDALVMLLLLAVGAVVVAGIGATLLSKAPKQTAPIATITVTAAPGSILIKHEGGDSIAYGDIQVLIYSYPAMTAVSGYPDEMENLNDRSEIEPSELFNTGDVRAAELSEGTYLVELIYVPTQTKIASAIVTVSSSSQQQ